MAETNRTPFDFAEGESEIVSGFNVEYGGGGFALFFLAEYASILFMSLLFCIIFLGSDLYSFLFYFRLALISFLFVWVHGTLPCFRYDKSMYLAWRRFSPLSLNYLLLFVGVRCFIFSLFLGLFRYYKLIEDLNFFHSVFKTLGFVYSFLTNY